MKRINEFQKIIDYLLSDVPKDLKDDLQQEFYLKILEILNNKNLKIKNLKNYIFISLKNKKYDYLSKVKQHQFISLNQTIDEFEQIQILDLIVDSSHPLVFDDIDKNFFLENLTFFMDKCFTKLEKKVFIDYYFHNIKQIVIAKSLNVSPQAVNSTLKRAIIKLKKYYYLEFA